MMALGLLVFLASGLLATLRVGGGSTALIVGLAGVVVFVAGVVLWMRSG